MLLTSCGFLGGEKEKGPVLSAAARARLVEAAEAASPGEASLATLRDRASRAPGDAEAQERYGLAAERDQQYGEALAALDRAIAAGGATEARLLARGRISLKIGDAPAAVDAYSKALARTPTSVAALNGRGLAHDLMRDHAAAREDYAAALRLSPRDWGVRGNLALSLLEARRADEAVATLADAETTPAAPRRARHDLALALVAAGQKPHAIRVLSADMPEPEAGALANEFDQFARWLADQGGK